MVIEYVRKWCYNGVMRRGRMEGRARMRLTTIPIHQILSLAQQFCKERPSRKKKFGRPLIYPEYLILTLFALKQVYRLSYRQIPSFVRDELGNIPCLSTLHYRVKKIEQERFEEFLRWLSKRGLYEGERESFGDK
jgi:hypothetical protein